MKKNLLLLAGGLLTLAACDSSEYDLINLVPEEYHKIIYVNNAGEQELTLYDTGEMYSYQLSVVKTGSEPTLTASGDIRILTQAEVDEQYSDVQAINFQVIPENTYSLEGTHVELGTDQRYQLINVSLDPTAIKAVIEAGEADAQWVLPFELVSETDSVNADMDQLFLQITGVITPSIGFSSTDVVVSNYTYGSALTLPVSFGLDTDNQWDITVDLGIGDESLIADYNRRNNTNFQLLPAGSYEMPSTAELPAGTTTLDIEISLNATLAPGEYMLPIVMSNPSTFQVSEDASQYLLAVRLLGNEIDRSTWTGEANTEEPSGEGAGNGVIECAIDGDESTYWHSVWQSGSHGFPHILTFDMGAQHTIVQFALKPRTGQYCGDTGSGIFEVSNDGSEWTQVGTFVMNGSEDLQYFTMANPTAGRYFRIQIQVGNRGTNTNVAEVYAYEE